MGAGKTTLAKVLAERLARPLADSDEELTRFVGVDGAAVAAKVGIDALHQIERALLFAALARPTPQVIAPAASVIEDPLVRQLLASTPVVRVSADLELIHARQRTGGHRRPMPLEELRALDRRRAPLFAEIEDGAVRSDQPVEAMAAEALQVLQASFEISP